MKFLPLVWAGLWRKPMRTIFTFLSIVIAYLLFGILAGFQINIANITAAAELNRLIVTPRFGTPLPAAYQPQIERVDGVVAVIKTDLLLGFYQDPKNTLPVLATTPEFLNNKNLTSTKEQRDALASTRTGALVSVMLAEKYGWKVGDKLPIQTSVLQKNGSRTWTLDVVGIINSNINPRTQPFIIANYDYVDQTRATNSGTVDMYRVEISDPTHTAEISAAIDSLFASSSAPTRTVSERANLENQLQSLGDVKFMTTSIGGAVLFMLLFLTANGAMQSVRERIPEFGTMKALGFQDRDVLAIVVAESIVLYVAGAAGGLGLVKVLGGLTSHISNQTAVLLHLALPWNAVAVGVALTVLASFASSMIPAWRVKRLDVVDALAGR